MTKDDLIAAVTSPKGQAIERALLSSTGYVGIKLAKWFGLNPDQLGDLTQLAIMVTPGAIALGWSLATKTWTSIVKQAAQILADRQAGAVIIKTDAAPTALVQVAHDPKAAAVLPAGSAEAKAAANPTAA